MPRTLLHNWLLTSMMAAVLVLIVYLMPRGPDYVRPPSAETSVGTGGAVRAAADETGVIPASLAIEHRALHETLAATIALGGPTGMAATHVAELMEVHFKSEEEFAMPPLALLRPLAEGVTNAAFADTIIAMSDRLKTDWPRMLQEHKTIREALSVLAVEARKENRLEVLEFVDKLKLHAQQEEEILYPAAILVGEYLKVTGSD